MDQFPQQQHVGEEVLGSLPHWPPGWGAEGGMAAYRKSLPIVCMLLACGGIIVDVCMMHTWLASSMQLAAIDKDFLKFRSDMEAKVSDQN